MALWFPRWVRKNTDLEFEKWVQAVIDRLAGTGDTGATLKNLFDANTILKADTDNTPEALSVTEGTVIGRATGGEIAALAAAQAQAVLDIAAQSQTTWETGTGTDESVISPAKLAAAVQAQAITETGVLKERTGSGSGTTWSAATSPQTITMPSSITLADVQFMEIWADWYSSTDSDSCTTTLILDDDTELTTSGYNLLQTNNRADGTPAIATSEAYGASTFRGLGIISNVAGETMSIKAAMFRSNDAQSHKQWLLQVLRFRADDDIQWQYDLIDALTTKRIKGMKFSQTGTFTGRAGIRAILS